MSRCACIRPSYIMNREWVTKEVHLCWEMALRRCNILVWRTYPVVYVTFHQENEFVKLKRCITRTVNGRVFLVSARMILRLRQVCPWKLANTLFPSPTSTVLSDSPTSRHHLHGRRLPKCPIWLHQMSEWATAFTRKTKYWPFKEPCEIQSSYSKNIVGLSPNTKYLLLLIEFCQGTSFVAFLHWMHEKEYIYPFKNPTASPLFLPQSSWHTYVLYGITLPYLHQNCGTMSKCH